jgi:predicted metal-dependent hydrolase
MADTFLLRAFIRAAQAQAVTIGGSATAKSVLMIIITGQFTSTAQNGRTLIESSEAGGTVRFTIPNSLGPAEVTQLAEEAIEWLEANTAADGSTPALKRVKRLRFCFDSQYRPSL